MALYATNPLYADLTPIPTDEGGPNPLASITYSPAYQDSMSYLRALMAADERSARSLALTTTLIDQNPAHYTVWLFRAACLLSIATTTTETLRDEVRWLNGVALEHEKNYQIWQHRQVVVDRLGEVAGERTFVRRMFERDAKNYHVWSYRQWLVARFGLWPDEDGEEAERAGLQTTDEHGKQEGEGKEDDDDDETLDELTFTSRLITKDPHNNSAWNHRWYVLHGRNTTTTHPNPDTTRRAPTAQTVARELAFTQHHIQRSPHSESGWSYLRALMSEAQKPFERAAGVYWRACC